MDTQKIAVIKQHLESEASTLNEKVKELRNELQAVEQDAKRITSAIAALDGKDLESPCKTPQKHRKQGKPAAKRIDVANQMAEILHGNDLFDEKQLYEAVEARLKSQGFSRRGLRLRFTEALTDEQFLVCANGIRQAAIEESLPSN